MRKTKLLVPGPVEVSAAVREELSKPVAFHRSHDFSRASMECLNKMHSCFGTKPSEYTTLIYSGCGTATIESAVLSLLGSQDRILVIVNGYFGYRIKEILGLAGLSHEAVELDWTEPMDLEAIERAIVRYRPSVLIMVALETSTGLVNATQPVGRLAKRYGLIFFVDAVSGYFAEDISISRDNIGICVTVTNKALEAPPGMGLLCVQNDLFCRLPKSATIPMALDLHRLRTYAEIGQTPFTPNIPMMNCLDKALDRYLDEGFDARSARYLSLSKVIRDLLPVVHLRCMFDERNSAKAITSIDFHEPSDAVGLQRHLEECGFTIWVKDYSHVNPRVGSVLQMSVMGDVQAGDIDRLANGIISFYA